MKNGTYSCVICFSLMRCWSQNCSFVGNTMRQGSKHNPTLYFQHKVLSWFAFCRIHDIIFVFLFEASDNYFAL
jgi:hypothetical protein